MSIYKKYGIYGIRNKINNKIYIGKTMQSFGDRWDCHRAMLNGGYHDNKHLQRAWDKYGKNNFEFMILVDCQNGETLEDVNKLEIEKIAEYKKLKLAYNIHNGGDGGLFLGKHLSDEAKRKIGEKNRINMTGRKLSEKTKKKMSSSQNERYARWTDSDREEWGKMLSESLTGIKKPSLSNSMKGNKRGAKYTTEQVLEVRKLFEQENKTYREIAEQLNMPRYTVYLIATYRRWKDI